MSLDAIVVMILSLSIVWGGFLVLLLTALRKNNKNIKNG
jgi:hypothetical protein